MRPQGKFVTSATPPSTDPQHEHRSRDATSVGSEVGFQDRRERFRLATRKDGFVQDLLAASIVET